MQKPEEFMKVIVASILNILFLYFFIKKTFFGQRNVFFFCKTVCLTFIASSKEVEPSQKKLKIRDYLKNPF